MPDPLDLEAIKERQRAVSGGDWDEIMDELGDLVETDVPALIAEVERLRDHAERLQGILDRQIERKPDYPLPFRTPPIDVGLFVSLDEAAEAVRLARLRLLSHATD